MKEDTRKRLAELILEELSEKIKVNENLGKKLEAFTDLPVEKVADAILKQFEYLLSSDLRDLIIHLIEQDVSEEEARSPESTEEAPASRERPFLPEPEVQPEKTGEPASMELGKETVEEESKGSIMEYFGTRGSFPTEPLDIELLPDDWYYLYGFGYSPESSGRGIPALKLTMTGVPNSSDIFLLDYGDVRFYIGRLNSKSFPVDKSGKPSLAPKDVSQYKFDHERTLNALRGNEVIVALPMWTVVQGHENVIKLIEDKYVDLLRALIDVHDAVDWDVEVYAHDEFIAKFCQPRSSEAGRARTAQRDAKHPIAKKMEVKTIEKVIFQEKTLAQDIHSQLLLLSAKAKVDHLIRLDSAFMDDWKSILAARYAVGKDKRKPFFKAIDDLQKQYKEYDLMIKVTSPSVRFKILS